MTDTVPHAEDLPPYIRMKWTGETLVRFNGVSASIAGHAKTRGKMLTSVLENLRVGHSLHVSLRDAKDEGAQPKRRAPVRPKRKPDGLPRIAEHTIFVIDRRKPR